MYIHIGSSNDNNDKSKGIGIITIIQIVLIILKLCGLIDWSWKWVLAPLWIGLILALILFILAILFFKWISK